MFTYMLKRSILYLALATMSLQAGSILIGNPTKTGTGNCDPFGCPALFGLGTYQEVYLASAFTNEIFIDGLTFFDGQVHNGGKPASGTYTLSFSYTGADPGALNLTTPNANLSSNSETFFSGSLPPLTTFPQGQELIIQGAPFDYNPAFGNLLLTVTVSGSVANGSPVLFLNQSACGPKTVCPAGGSVVSSSAYYGASGMHGGNDSGGLVTQFDFGTPATAPEPASWMLAAAGIGLLAYRKSRRSA